MSQASPLIVLMLLPGLLGLPRSALADQALKAVLHAPRPFGFVIGDRIHHRIEIEVGPEQHLKRDSVPASGRINYWLELNKREIQMREHAGKIRYRIDLFYQTFYAPRQVEPLQIPGFSLAFKHGSESVEAPVDPWHFTMSVIRDLSILPKQGGPALRSDDPPRPFDLNTPLRHVGVLALALLALLFGSAYYFGFLPFSRRGRIFHEALLNLVQFAPGSSDPERLNNAFYTLHHAFNRIHGRALFYDRLESFFSAHPEFQCIESEIRAFYEASNRVFFSAANASPENYPIERAIALCRDCRALERGIR